MVAENPKVSVMAEVISPKATGKGQNRERPISSSDSSLARSLNFKYYIHDSVSTLRFQLIGDLRSANVPELNGSWDTARTTLGSRRFLLDVRHLHSTDEEGQSWLSIMSQSGAHFLPENYQELPVHQASKDIRQQDASVKLSLIGRVVGVFLGCRS